MAGSVGNVYSEALFELAAEQDCAKETFDELMALKGEFYQMKSIQS